jgi:Flp pilus assembly protein TadD
MATFHKLAALLLLAGAITGCSSFSGGSLSGWIPGWSKKPDQGLSWTTPDLSKTYGNNIGAERGGTFEPRTEMPKPEEEGRLARMRSAVTQSGPVKAVTSVFTRNKRVEAAAAVAAAEPAFNPKTDGGSVYVGLARLQESQGNVAAAAEAYERALQTDSSNLEALLGYARLQDRQGNFPRATQLYQTAVRLHPNDAATLNDLGLCLSRQGKKVEAQAALAQAVNLKPDRTLYRNNLAKLLVDVGQPQLALDHLLAVHAPPVAHYNLGYLLQQKNEPILARQHFARALELDPNLADARQWLVMLDGQRVAEAPPQPGANQGAYAPATPQYGLPAAVPAQPATSPRVSIDSGFYLPSRY